MYPKRTFIAFIAIAVILGGSTVFANLFSSGIPQQSLAPHAVEIQTTMRGKTLEIHHISQADYARITASLERQFDPFDIDNCIETSPGNCYMSGSSNVVYLPY